VRLKAWRARNRGTFSIQRSPPAIMASSGIDPPNAGAEFLRGRHSGPSDLLAHAASPGGAYRPGRGLRFVLLECPLVSLAVPVEGERSPCRLIHGLIHYTLPFGQRGLMAGLGLEGSKITHITPTG
jgi:hypothetical protein